MPVLRVPCTYQGGKQRIASQIANDLLRAQTDKDGRFYDLCCGSGAVTLELVNRGISPEQITMLDLSSWGAFWSAIGSGTFRVEVFDRYLMDFPQDKALVRAHAAELANTSSADDEPELYPILQACAFGGKQIWWDGNRWRNAFFRKYWQPTPTSKRRSPANTMQPQAEELLRRVHLLVDRMAGVEGLRMEITDFLERSIPVNAVIYIDPPYDGTTDYGFRFDIQHFVEELRQRTDSRIFVSEAKPLGPDSKEIILGGANGGISGNRIKKHREWLTAF